MSHEKIKVKHTAGDRLALDDVAVGDHVVSFTLELVGAPPLQAVKFIAKSDAGGHAEHTMTLPTAHDYTEEQFLLNVRQQAWVVAQEAAGRGQDQKFVEKFFPLKKES